MSNAADQNVKKTLSNLCTTDNDKFCFPTMRKVLATGVVPLNSTLCTDTCLARTAATMADDATTRSAVRVFCVRTGAMLCGDVVATIPGGCDPSSLLDNTDFCNACTAKIQSIVPNCCWGHLVRNAIETGTYSQAEYSAQMTKCNLSSSIALPCTSSTRPATTAYKFTGRVAFKAPVAFVKANEVSVIGAAIGDLARQLGVTESDIVDAKIQYGLQVLLIFAVQTPENTKTAKAETMLNTLLATNGLNLQTLQNFFASDKSNEGQKMTLDVKSSKTGSAANSTNQAACEAAWAPIKSACAGYETMLGTNNSIALRAFCQQGCATVAASNLAVIQARCSSSEVEVAALLSDVLCTMDAGVMCYSDVRPIIESFRFRSAFQAGSAVTTAQLDSVCAGTCARTLSRARTNFAARLSRFGVNANSDADQAFDTVLLQTMCLKEGTTYCFPSIAPKLQTIDKFFATVSLADVCDTQSLCMSRFVQLTSKILGDQDQPKNASAVLRSQCAYNSGNRCGAIFKNAVPLPEECAPKILQGTSCPSVCAAAYASRAATLGCCLRNYHDSEAEGEGSYAATQAAMNAFSATLAMCNVSLPARCAATFSADRKTTTLSINVDFTWCQADLDRCKATLIADFAASAGLTQDNFLDFTARNGSIASTFTVATESSTITAQAVAVLSSADNIAFTNLQTTYSADQSGAVLVSVAATAAPTATPTPAGQTASPPPTFAGFTDSPTQTPTPFTITPQPIVIQSPSASPVTKIGLFGGAATASAAVSVAALVVALVVLAL